MGIYQYTARSAAGELTSGAIQADNEAAVVRALDEKHLYPVRVTEQASSIRAAKAGRVRSRDVGVLYGQLADLLRSGVPVMRSLEVLNRATTSRRLSAIVSKVHGDVAAGKSLAESMGAHPTVFKPLHIAMVRAGERAGFLEDVLQNMAEFVEREDELRSKVLGAMIYPMVVVTVGLAVASGVLMFLVPMFRPMLADLPSVPWPTQVLFAVSDAVYHFWPLVLVLLVLAGSAAWGFIRSEAGRRKWDRWRLRIPLVGRATQLVSITRFCRVLGMMLKNGVPMLQALAISKDATGSIILADSIEAAAENVRAGQTLAEPLRASGYFPTEIIEMVAVAEESNQLEKTLVQIADTVERRTTRQVDLAVRLIEPLMLVMLASGIGFFALALIYPIFSMTSAIGGHH
jgi:general secretion pathway protein F/type IV pilus assembly protein PilC